MSFIPGISTHRLLALLGVLAIATGTTTGVITAGLLALAVLVREVDRMRVAATARAGRAERTAPLQPVNMG